MPQFSVFCVRNRGNAARGGADLYGTAARYQAASAEKRVRLFRALESGDQGRVQCDSHGTFDTRGTVRTRRSRSIKRIQGPAADRAASQQGLRRTTNAQQSTRGICPHSHREESSRQQVDKDRRTAEHVMNSRRLSSTGLLPQLGPLARAMTISWSTAPSPAGRNYIEGGGGERGPLDSKSRVS